MSTLNIKEIMANAKKQIEERKNLLQAATSTAASSDSRLAAMAALQAKIAQSMGNLEQKGVLKIPIPSDKVNLVLDSQGRAVDKSTGQILAPLITRQPTLKVNMRAAQKRDYRTMLKDDDATNKSKTSDQLFGVDLNEDVAASETSNFYDARLKLRTTLRNKRKLAFHDKGKFVSLAKKLRDRAKLDLLTREIAQISKKTGISSESKLALIQPKRFQRETTVPSIEWWDYAVLSENTYDCVDLLTDAELHAKLRLPLLIEHPVQMKPPCASDKPIAPTVMLTKKERKKIRRQSRAEALKEDQEKIRLGLMPPPEPKVKISNLMRVLGTEAVQDPTKVEEYVRNQMAKRQKIHEEKNAARKLSDEQRGEKKKKKIMEDTSNGVSVSVYRVKDLNDPSVKFKIETNCNQLHMTGVVILCKMINVVVVEGGPKQQKKFKRLMMNRIKWSDIVNKKAEIKETNSCALVWEGMVKTRCFSNIIFKSCPTVTFAREYFKKHSVEHYWDIAQSDAILELSDL